MMDAWWYHRLLGGAVNHGMDIEARARAVLPEISLATKIKEASPLHIWKCRIGSNTKIHGFYIMGLLLLVAAVVVAFCVLEPTVDTKEGTKSRDRQSEMRPLHPSGTQAPSAPQSLSLP